MWMCLCAPVPSTQCHDIGEKWYGAFFKRMKALPEYADIVETKSGRATDTTKLKYYNTENINYWYDEVIKLLCDELKIAKRNTEDEGDKCELIWTCDKNRVLFTDETAVKDRNEGMRLSKKFKMRITRCFNLVLITQNNYYIIFNVFAWQGKKCSKRQAKKIR